METEAIARAECDGINGFFQVRETVHILHVYETAYAVAYLSCCIGFEL